MLIKRGKGNYEGKRGKCYSSIILFNGPVFACSNAGTLIRRFQVLIIATMVKDFPSTNIWSKMIIKRLTQFQNRETSEILLWDHQNLIKEVK